MCRPLHVMLLMLCGTLANGQDNDTTKYADVVVRETTQQVAEHFSDSHGISARMRQPGAPVAYASRWNDVALVNDPNDLNESIDSAVQLIRSSVTEEEESAAPVRTVAFEQLMTSLRSSARVSSARPRPFWFRADQRFWWTEGVDLPPLVTTSPNGTVRTEAGVLGESGTEILSPTTLHDKMRSGFLVQVGRGLESLPGYAFQAELFSVFSQTGSAVYSYDSGGSMILARPFLDAQAGTQVAELVSYTDPSSVAIAAGGVSIIANSSLYSGAFSIRKSAYLGQQGELDWIAGYRYFRYEEDLSVDERVISLDPGGLAAIGTQFALEDRFATENDFHGVEFGFLATFNRALFDFEFVGKVALGNIHQKLAIAGSTTVTAPPPTSTQATSIGGLLAQSTNIGRYSNDEFGVLPEVNANILFRLTRNIDLGIGYSLVALNSVVRTGDQIDTVINTSQFGGGTLAGPARPVAGMSDTGLVAHGINLTVTLTR